MTGIKPRWISDDRFSARCAGTDPGVLPIVDAMIHGRIGDVGARASAPLTSAAPDLSSNAVVVGQLRVVAHMSIEDKKMSGAQRAATLLVCLGREEATAVLKNLEPKDVETIAAAMANIPLVSRQAAEPVIDAFLGRFASGDPFSGDSQEYMREILVSVFGKQRAETILDRVMSGSTGTNGMEALEGMDPRAIVQIISDEHPQIVAALIAQLDGGLAAKVVLLLPEAMRADVVMRVATIQELPQAALSELDRIVAELVASGPRTKSRRIGGNGTAADIVNGMDRDSGEALLGAIEAKNADLHQQIKDLLFVFDDLGDLEDGAIQAILREVSSGILAAALRGAEPAVANKIFANMSKRAATILREDMDARGPMRVSEVEGAQREILNVALKLAEEGVILIGRNATEYV